MPKSESLLSLFAQSRLFKEQWEQFALVALYKRAIVSKSLSISFQKSNVSDSLVIQANCSQNTSDSLEKSYFSYF